MKVTCYLFFSNTFMSIGWDFVWYPWSAIPDWVWYRILWYRTEESESEIISDIGINFCPIFDIQNPTVHRLAQWLRGIALAHENKKLELDPKVQQNILILEIGMDSDVNIGTLQISGWQFSVWHIFFRYQNNRCWCQMSDIANIQICVDAHLC